MLLASSFGLSPRDDARGESSLLDDKVFCQSPKRSEKLPQVEEGRMANNCGLAV
jgi:hypothetical protein